jgi:hypothetical protein
MAASVQIYRNEKFSSEPITFFELFFSSWRNNCFRRRRNARDAIGTERDLPSYPLDCVAPGQRSEAGIMKFTIEITRGSSPRKRFQRKRQHYRSAAAAITEAEKLLQTLRAANPENPPEGYRVLDRSDKLVDCGWGSARGN